MKISYNTTEKANIKARITITRDENGIPRIQVSTIQDLYYALGFLHATDQSENIEYLRALANGHSEYFTKKESVFLNNLARIIGYTRHAAEIKNKLSQDEIKNIESYISGINHVKNRSRIAILTDRDWRVEDVLSILIMKEWANSYLNNPKLIFNFTENRRQTLSTLDNRYIYFYNEDNIQQVYILRRIKEIVNKYICTFNRGNSIYIGQKYLTNDSPYIISFSYENSTTKYPEYFPVIFNINSSEIDALTAAGLPFLFSFRNESIALTQFNMDADSQHFYIFETETKNDTSFYKINGTLKKFESVRNPSFNKNETSFDIKWITEKGPVISELVTSAKSTDTILVLESVLPGIQYIKMLLNVPFQDDLEKIKNLVSSSDGSLKCFLLTDNKKAYKIYSGLFNNNDNEKNLFVNGNNASRHTFSKILAVKQIDGVEYIGSDLPAHPGSQINIKNIVTNDFKDERFRSLLPQKKVYDDDSVQNLISDNKSVTAEKFIPVFKTMLETNPLTSSRLTKVYIGDWDYSIRTGIQAPSIFYTTLYFYINETFKDEFGKDNEYNLSNYHLLYPTLFTLITNKDSQFFDNAETTNSENREMIFDISFLNAIRFLSRQVGPFMENWKWGEINKAHFRIPEKNDYFFSKFFKIEKQPLNGGPDTITTSRMNSNFIPVNITSLSGYISSGKFKFKMNYAYSTSVFSVFYYGKKDPDTSYTEFTSPVYTTVINPL